MLMAAVTSTLLNAETTSTRSAASGHTESVTGSFVDSLVENTVIADEMPSNAGIQAKPTNAAESDPSTHGKTSSAAISTTGTDTEMRSAICVVGELENRVKNAMLAGTPGSGKTNGLVADKPNSSVTGVALQRNGAPNKTDVVSEPTISDGQPVPTTSGPEINLGQILPREGTMGTEPPDPQIAPPAPVAGTDGSIKQVITAKNAISLPVDGQVEDTVGTVAKELRASGKTEKTVKSDAKHDKKDTSVIAIGAAGVDAQVPALVQVLTNSAGAQQSAVGDAESDVLASNSVSTFNRSAGTTVAANGKNNKAPASTAKQDDNDVKGAGSSPIDNPPSQKVEADAAKPQLSVASNRDDNKAKSQNTVASAVDIGQSRAVSVTAVPVPAFVSGSGPTQNAGVGPHMTGGSPHAVATAQPGPNFIGTASPVDAAHTTLSATPTSLEVGVANGTHGWLKIRAEMADGGTVNTSLSTSSAVGQEMLHRELPSLAAYLKSEHVAVNAVVIQPMAANGSDPRGSFAGASGGAHGQAQHSASQGRENRQNPMPAHAAASDSYSSVGAMGDEEISSSIPYVQGGGWLSVRA